MYSRKYNCPYEKVGKEVKNISDEIPFELPTGWAWCRLGRYVDFNLGKTPERHSLEYWRKPKYPWVSISDMIEGKIIKYTKEKISEIALIEKFANKLIPKNTLIMSFKLTIGKVSILGMDAQHNEAIISINTLCDENNVLRNFLFKFLPFFTNLVGKTDAIKGSTLNSSKLNNMLMAIPPLAEQKRIVEKLKELEPLIAEYDSFEKENAKLDKEIAEKLKKSILQYAIQGKLVKQDPTDEPASVLLDRILEERAKEQPKGKKSKQSTPSRIYKNSDDNSYYENGVKIDVPFCLPDSWNWVRYGTITESIQYGFNAPAKTKGTIRMVRISDINQNSILWNSVPYCDIKEEEMPKYLLKKGDILFARTGGTVGKSFLIENLPYNSIYAGYLIRTRCSKFLSTYFLKYFMETQLYWQQLQVGTIATAQPNCNGQTLSKMILPLPPSNEQIKICNNISIITKELDKITV